MVASIKHIRSGRKSEQAYGLIKEMIVSTELPPGATIDERALEQRLSLGRTPVREAIMRLAAEELVVPLPGKGHVVRQLSLEDVRAMFESMMIFEQAAAQLAVRRIRPADIDRLEELDREMDLAMAALDSLAATRLNGRFHRIVYAATGNSFLESALSNIQNQAQRLVYFCFSQRFGEDDLAGHFVKVARDHKRIIACLRAGDRAGLIRAATDHVHLFHHRVSRYTSPEALGLEAGGALVDSRLFDEPTGPSSSSDDKKEN